MTERRCEGCGALLSDEDVMRVQLEDGSWETVPLPLCPRCFRDSLARRLRAEKASKARV